MERFFEQIGILKSSSRIQKLVFFSTSEGRFCRRLLIKEVPFKQEIWKLFWAAARFFEQMRECSRVPQESKNWCIFFDVRRPVLFKTFDIKKCLLNRRSGNSFWAKAKNAQSRQEPSVTSTGRSIDCISDVQNRFLSTTFEKKSAV